MFNNVQEESKTKKAHFLKKVTYKPIIKNINFNCDYQKQPTNGSFSIAPNNFKYQPKPHISNQRYDQVRPSNPKHYKQTQNNTFIVQPKPITYPNEPIDADEKNQHKRAISLFRMRLKKNQLFLPKQKTTEAAAVDSFMFSFYNPRKQIKTQNGRPDNNITKGHAATYDNRYSINQLYQHV